MKSWQDRVKKLVEKLGSPEKLAGALNVSYFTVKRWIEGESEPRPIAQDGIAKLEKEFQNA